MSRAVIDSAHGSRRRDVLELFRMTQQALTAREVADELGLHLNTARFHLDALVRAGTLRRDEGQADRPGRPAARYSLVPGMDRGGPRNWRLLAEMLLSYLATQDDGPAAAVTAGEAWGRYLVQPVAPGQEVSADEAVDRLVDMLEDIGFAPRYVADPSHPRIELRHCPFLELAETHQELVCALHLGLLRGALDQLRSQIRADTLVPFADPQTCVASLSAEPATSSR